MSDSRPLILNQVKENVFFVNLACHLRHVLRIGALEGNHACQVEPTNFISLWSEPLMKPRPTASWWWTAMAGSSPTINGLSTFGKFPGIAYKENNPALLWAESISRSCLITWSR